MNTSMTIPTVAYIKGDYLVSALESELKHSSKDSAHLTYLRETLSLRIQEYMKGAEAPCTPEDSQRMEAIDLAVNAVRTQRMAKSISYD